LFAGSRNFIMSEKPEVQSAASEKQFSDQVGKKAARKLRARRHVTRTVWSGLGMIGLVGWSVAVPTLLGAALGVWADKHYPARHSWTLTLLAIGLALGCINAWHWVAKENEEIREQEENTHE
jgi:ATP synthase protein I